MKKHKKTIRDHLAETIEYRYQPRAIAIVHFPTKRVERFETFIDVEKVVNGTVLSSAQPFTKQFEVSDAIIYFVEDPI